MDDTRLEPHTPGPGERARLAYLDLLKLALCDLVTASTESVVTERDGPVAYGLAEADLSDRLEGRDWPLRGLTMIGYERLADLQHCIEGTVADAVPGDVIEAGVWRGGASILARATLDSLGHHERKVWLADSFRGLPAPDSAAFPEDEGMNLHTHEFLSVPQAQVQAAFARLGLDHDLEFVEGFFSDTLPALRDGEWSIVRLDGDMYESTWVTLESLYPGLSKGGYLIVDDYGVLEQCRRAVHDFRDANGITAPLEHIGHTAVRWRREDAPSARAGVAAPSRARVAPHAEGQPARPIRTERERDLEAEVAELQARIAELGAPRPGLLSRLRR